MTVIQIQKFVDLMAPIARMIESYSCDPSTEKLKDILVLIAETSPSLANCFNGAEQFPKKDPNQLELPLGTDVR